MTIWASKNMLSTVTIKQSIAKSVTNKPYCSIKSASSAMASDPLFSAVSTAVSKLGYRTGVSSSSYSTSSKFFSVKFSSSCTAVESNCDEPGLIFKIKKLVVRNKQIIDLNIRANSDAHTNFFDAF